MYALANPFQRNAKQVFHLLKLPKSFFLVKFWGFKLYAGRQIGTGNELSTSNLNLNSKQEQNQVN